MHLLIIESPHQLKGALNAVRATPELEGFDWQGAPTFGHLLDYRSDPFDLEWTAVNPEVFKALAERLPEADSILVATDPDEEGERIAYQVLKMCERLCPETSVQRLRVYAWTPELISEALTDPVRQQFDEELAYSAERRRTFDRIIGMTFQAGRIKSCLLEAWRNNPPATHYSEDRMERIHPQDCSAILMEATRYGMSVSEAYTALCESWENGFCTYPRTDGMVYDQSIAELAVKIAQSQGMMANRDLTEVIGEKGSHTALAPANVERQPGELPIMDIIRKLTAASVSRRMISRPSATKEMPMDARWLSLMRDTGLGRPSTYASHTERLIKFQAISPNGEVNPALLEKAHKLPEVLLNSDQKALHNDLKGGSSMADLFRRWTGTDLKNELILPDKHYRSETGVSNLLRGEGKQRIFGVSMGINA